MGEHKKGFIRGFDYRLTQTIGPDEAPRVIIAGRNTLRRISANATKREVRAAARIARHLPTRNQRRAHLDAADENSIRVLSGEWVR